MKFKKIIDPNFGELSHTKIKLIYWGYIKDLITKHNKHFHNVSEIDQIKRIVYRHFDSIKEELGLIQLYMMRSLHKKSNK